MASTVNREMLTGASTRASSKAFLVTLAAGCVILAMAAWQFALLRRVPAALAVPIALAFVTEYVFYLLLGFEALRDRLRQRLPRLRLAACLALSGALPYLVYSVPARAFHPAPALAWTAILLLVSFCFVPHLRSTPLTAVRDLAFLALLAALILSGILRWIFPAPLPKLPLEVLGHVTLIRTAILAVLLIRGSEPAGIGFVPRLRDLGIGALWFAVCAAIALPLGLRLGQFHLTARHLSLWPSLALVLGVFWVLALSEEFFFRGLLQQWISRWTRSPAAGLVLGAILFAACHLGFRGAFPNWRVAVLSLILGLCCGGAFLQARGIRASMVTHALAVGAWRLLLG